MTKVYVVEFEINNETHKFYAYDGNPDACSTMCYMEMANQEDGEETYKEKRI